MARAGRPKAKLELTENERAQLLRWSRRQKSSPAQTGVDLLTDKQAARLEALFADEQHSEVEAT